MAQNIAELIGFRTMQGLGGGGLIVGVLAIIGELIPPRERGRYQGVMMAVMPVAMIGGPLLGGFITDHLSWRWAFYVNLPLGVMALAVIGATLKLPRRTGKAVIDWTGAVLLTIWISALVLITGWGGSRYPWSSWQIIGLGAGFAMFGAVTFLPQFQQYVQGASAISSGLLLMPMMIAAMVVSLAGGQLITKTGRYRALPIVGTALLAAGLLSVSTMGLHTSR